MSEKLDNIGMGKIDIEEAFLNKINQLIINKSIDDSIAYGTRRKAFRPSDYFGCCRAKYYELNDTPIEDTDFTAQSVCWTENGKTQHSWIQIDVIKKYMDEELKEYDITKLPSYNQPGINIKLDSRDPLEVKFVDERHTMFYPISGKVDGLFEFQKQPLIFEFKTAKDKKFKEVEKHDKPLEDHISQGAIYSLCLDRLPVMFLYYNKDNQKLLPKLYVYSDEEIDIAINKINTVETFIALDDLPPQEGSFMECKFCNYHKICWRTKYLEEWKLKKGIKK